MSVVMFAVHVPRTFEQARDHTDFGDHLTDIAYLESCCPA